MPGSLWAGCPSIIVSSNVLLLSWYKIVVGMCTPCAARKCFVHSICPISSLTPANSSSVELFVFNFFTWCCVCSPFSYGHEYSVVTFHFWMYCVGSVHPPLKVVVCSIFSASFWCPWCTSITLPGFLQWSVSGSLTFVYRTTMAVCMSCLVHCLR